MLEEGKEEEKKKKTKEEVGGEDRTQGGAVTESKLKHTVILLYKKKKLVKGGRDLKNFDKNCGYKTEKWHKFDYGFIANFNKSSFLSNNKYQLFIYFIKD